MLMWDSKYFNKVFNGFLKQTKHNIFVQVDKLPQVII